MTAFIKETDLCTAFIAALPKTWTAYPETGGFDILLVRKADGFQIGVEAKLKLNAKVISQAAENSSSWHACYPGPDCRAVLVPESVSYEMSAICNFIGLTVIRTREVDGQKSRYWGEAFRPALPGENYSSEDNWFELVPFERLDVPDWVPDVMAGSPSPVSLTHWKINAIKIVVTLQKRGFVTRKDFKHFGVSMPRWISGTGWLIKDGKGGWIKGPHLPDFKVQHPVNYKQIAAEYEAWKSPEVEMV